MTTIVTRAGKGSPLTNAEVDANFTNLDANKLELIVTEIASASTITPPSENTQYNVTALAVAATIAAPSGSPTAGKKLILRLEDNGTARVLTWNAIYRAIGVTLPSTTMLGKTMYIGMSYNGTDTKWDVIAINVEV